MRKKGGKKHKKRLAVIFVIVVLALSDVFGFVFLRHGKSNSQTIFAAADTFISSQSGVTDNKYLDVSNAGADCSTTTDCAISTNEIYLKFKTGNFPAYKKVESVTLQLYATNLSGDGGQVYKADNNWQASTIDWDNAPQAAGRAIGSVGPVLNFGVTDIALPPDILGPNGEVTLVIKSNDRNVAEYKSSAFGKSGPSLRVSFGNLQPRAVSSRSYEILAGGDVACGSETIHVDDEDCMQATTAKLIGEQNPDDVLVLGDEQYNYGELRDFKKFFNLTWGQYKSLLKPTPGNHEYVNSYDLISHGCTAQFPSSPFAFACGYFDYFNGRNNLSGQAGVRGKGYYAFSLGNWRIYAVNSNCTDVNCSVGSDQERWLRQDLAHHVSSCKLMFMHHPITSSDPNNFDGDLSGLPDPTHYSFIQFNQSNLSNLYQAFYDYGGDLVLTGHSHFYERFAPQNINRQADPNGFREIVVGTGGRYTYDVDSAHMRPLSLVHSKAGDHGLLKLNLEANSYAWNFVPTPGTHFSDQGAGTCHANN